jgi:hypothetical protein
MTTYQALYYPYIHFKDEGWLKLAALYWDRLARIVPHDYTTHDSTTVQALGGFVRTVRPDWVQPGFGAAFVDFIAAYAPKLQPQYAVALRDHWPWLPEAQRPPRAGGGSGTDLRLGYIYDEKLDPDLRRLLCDTGLACTDTRDERWVGMHPRLAWVYMTALAEQIAGERGLRPLTDETRDHVAVSSLSPERLAQTLLDTTPLVGAAATGSEVEAVLVSVAFQAVVPKHLASLDVDKILAFRDKYPQERALFQQATADLLKSRAWLQQISDPRVLEERLRDEVDKHWAARLAELRSKLEEVGIETMLGCFNLKAMLPAGVAGAAAAMALPLNPIAAGAAGVALGAIPVLWDKRKAAQAALKTSPLSYLYRMEQDLQPKDLWARVQQKTRAFALGI